MGNALRLGISRIGLAWTKWRMKTKIKRKPISVLILGLQETGKTTIALRLWKYKRILPDLLYVQTKGFNTYTILRKNKSTINLYDLGGHSSIQELWEHYYADAHGVIFVVDVSDRTRISDAGEIFAKVLHDDRIRGKPVLLLANKHDLNEAATEVELDRLMNLQEVVNSVRCLTRLEETTATDLKNDKGIFNGFRWLVSHIENHYLELNERVMEDSLVEQNKEKARRVMAKETMATLSSPAKSSGVERPLSQKSQRSLKYVRTESSIDLETVPSNPYLSRNEIKEENGTTNYLIKSRPSSSAANQEVRTPNPFLVERNVSTAPPTGRDSARGQSSGNSARISLPNNSSAGGDLVEVTGEMDVADGIRDDKEALVKNSSTEFIGNSSVGRLSPEGADSDEGIVNPAFDASLEDEVSSRTTFASKIGHFSRNESSDNERPAEITMVTTLVQVHEDQISKDRRGSTTSTHDSVTISLSSLKSDDVETGWRDEAPPIPATVTTPSSTTPTGSTGFVPGANSFSIQTSSKLQYSNEKDQGKRKYSLRPRNKTGPFPPGISISTVQSSLESPNHSRLSGTTVPIRKSSVPGSGNSKLKKKSLSGFSDSRATQSGSQFVRELTSSQMERLKKY